MRTKSSPIAEHREKHRLTLEAFGRLFGVHKTTVRRWELDRAPADRVIEIERLTGLSRQVLRPDIFGEAAAPVSSERTAA
ncbi:YdaS family helix-turn-helix protein [Jiella avicenniae]|uniref:Helix-turn-helix domain-containing protein n=1 Tax=Jiella avicenniae TaxID=2907202 RepID=A0A9X1NVE3_9HYPH|nr:YdaS family helix-turn-helix protein [Jiella avicenniae]MCE7026400.1 helix-turn-helix domain-containing protein [Jiella avicenniae]